MDSRLVWVCLGGAVGTAARYGLASWAGQTFGTTFPLGTLLVNALGSFLLGVVMQVGLSGEVLSPTVRSALAVGLLGGFTTYSSYCYETLEYLRAGAWLTGCSYAVGTLIACLVACALGMALVRSLVVP